MNLHEYQAKALLKKYGMPVQEGILATNADEAVAAFEQLGGKFAVMKAQVHAGGRGKAGGVKVAKSKEDVIEFANNIIGTRLVTYQTDANGQPVNSIIVAEDVYPVERELYLGAVVDRSSRRITFMASTEGGVEIEKVAEETPEKIIKVEVDPLVGLQPFQAREVAFALGLKDKQIGQFVKIMSAAYQAFVETGDIFNKEVATKFRKEILARAGQDEAMTLYVNFRGKEPGIDPLLKNRGLK